MARSDKDDLEERNAGTVGGREGDRSDGRAAGAVRHAASGRHGRRRDQGRAAGGRPAAPVGRLDGPRQEHGPDLHGGQPQQALALPRPQEAGGGRGAQGHDQGRRPVHPQQPAVGDRAARAGLRGPQEDQSVDHLRLLAGLCAQGAVRPQAGLRRPGAGRVGRGLAAEPGRRRGAEVHAEPDRRQDDGPASLHRRAGRALPSQMHAARGR